MSSKFPFLNPTFLILISVLVFRVLEVPSRPIATNPADYVATVSSENSAVVLKSSDGEKFTVELPVALQSEYIKQVIDDGGFSGDVSLPNITGEVLARVIDYCKKHVDSPGAGNSTAVDELKAFDAEFVNVHHDILFKFILAANDLKIKSLLDLTTQKVADLVKGKTPAEIRKMFNVRDAHRDYEKDEQFLQESAWAFERENLPTLSI